MHLKLIQKMNSKKVETTNYLIGYKIVNVAAKLYDNKITRTSAQNTSDTVPSKTKDIKFDAKIPKERHIFPEKDEKLLTMLD